MIRPNDLDLDDKPSTVSKESEEESESSQQQKDLAEVKARERHRRSEKVKDHLVDGMIVIIWVLVICVIVATVSLVVHYAICPHLSEVQAEVLKGALASFTILNAVLIITKTIDLN